MKKTIIALFYLVQFLACYPILRYIYYFVLNDNDFSKDKYVFERVFISSPILIIVGLIMLFFLKKFNRIAGGVFVCIGMIWLFVLIKSAAGEAG